jgi:hypothetical protein
MYPQSESMFKESQKQVLEINFEPLSWEHRYNDI